MRPQSRNPSPDARPRPTLEAVVSCTRRQGRIRAFGTLPRSHGRPKAEAVSRAHAQAPRAAQDLRAGVQRVPAVPQPAAAASRLPDVRQYDGRDVVAADADDLRHDSPARADRSRSPSTRTARTSVPPRSRPARRSPPQQGVRVLLFGPAAEIGDAPDGVEVVDAPVSIAKAAGPGAAPSARRPTPRSCTPPRPSPPGAPTRSCPAARPGRRSPPACSTSSARAASTARRSRSRCRSPGAPVPLLDVGANVEVRPEHLVQFAYMGAAFAQAVLGVDAPARGAALQRRGADEGHARRASPPTRARRAPAGAAELRRQRRGHAGHRGRRRRVVTDGFTGNVALKLMEGVSSKLLRRDPRRPRWRRRARRLGGLLLRRRCGGCATTSTPRAPGGAYLLGLRRLGVVAARPLHAHAASRARSTSPRAACARTSSAARTTALEAARRAAAGARRPSRRLACSAP